MLTVVLFSLLHVSAKNGGEESATTPMSNDHFREYAMNVESVLANNMRIIESLQRKYVIANKSVLRKIRQLHVENSELMADLKEYKEFGIGDWRIFRKEFNEDLTEINKDLEILNNLVIHEFLLAERNK